MERLFASFPLGTISFFRKILILGFVGGAIVFLPVGQAVLSTSNSPHHCDGVLRTYHLVRLSLFFLQLPLRAYLLSSLMKIEALADRAAVVASCNALCQSTIWQLNQASGVCIYWCFAFACVFVTCAPHCASEDATESVWLYRWTVVSAFMFVMHMLVSGWWLRGIITEDAFEAAMWKRGAQTVQISAHTKLLRYSPTVRSDYNPTALGIDVSTGEVCIKWYTDDIGCSICMADTYENNENVRLLSCNHHYHASCVDEWLKLKKCCPLCSKDIDQPPSIPVTRMSKPESDLQQIEIGSQLRLRRTHTS